MAEANTATGIVEDATKQTATAPTEAGTAADQVKQTLAEGERQPWWPEGVNSEAELQTYVEGLNKPQTDEEKAAAEAKAAEEKAKEDEPPARTDDEIKAALKEAGGIYADPKYEPFAIEVEKTGALSPASITAAATAFGVPEDYVKAFVDGQKAKSDLAKDGQTKALSAAQMATATSINSVFTGDNGPAEYEAFIGWGSANLSPEEKTAYDSAMDRGDQATVKTLLSAFRTRYQAEGNTTRRDITQRGQGATGDAAKEAGATKPFGSLSEGRAAMSTRRYQTDPGYRAEVDARYILTEA